MAFNFFSKKTKTAPKKPFQLKLLHLLLPYIIGVTWTCLHPILSVVTGELKCRGSYIDESGLDVHRINVETYPSSNSWYMAEGAEEEEEKNGRNGLCLAIKHGRNKKWMGATLADSMDCFVYHPNHNPSSSSSFDIAKITPKSSPVEPVESIVLVINNTPSSSSSWTESEFHSYILTLLQRLSDPVTSPWLAKTILLVSPHFHSSAEDDNTTDALDQVVQSFLNSYNGVLTTTTNTKLLPPKYTSTLIRTLLVYNIQTSTTSKVHPTVQILPMGTHGTLPNLDLVFAINDVYDSSNFFKVNGYYQRGKVVHHGYDGNVKKLKRRWMDMYDIKEEVRVYVEDLLSMFAFGLNLAVGPYPPHKHALNMGIDSLTIQSTLPSSYTTTTSTTYPQRFVPKIEQTIHALSNLHERLHHSITQYLLPTSSKFVSHGEYIYPMILIMISWVLRAGSLALVDIWRFDFRIGCGVVLGGVASSVGCMVLSLFLLGEQNELEEDMKIHHVVYSLIYVLVLSWIGYFVVGTHKRTSILMQSLSSEQEKDTEEKVKERKAEANEWKRTKQSIQFLACLIAIYLHVPIALSHVSLAYPSALFWCPVLSFPWYGCSQSFEQQEDSNNRKKMRMWAMRIVKGLKMILAVMVLVVSWPPVLLVPRVFQVYTVYILMVYTPLHLFLATLWLF